MGAWQTLAPRTDPKPRLYRRAHSRVCGARIDLAGAGETDPGHAHPGDDCDRTVEFPIRPRNRAATRVVTSPAKIIVQLFSHEVHHRAQVMFMLKQLRFSAENLDVFWFVFEGAKTRKRQNRAVWREGTGPRPGGPAWARTRNQRLKRAVPVVARQLPQDNANHFSRRNPHPNAPFVHSHMSLLSHQ